MESAKPTAKKIEQESRWLSILLPPSFLLILTGIIVALPISSFTTIQQFNILGHVLLGAVSTAPLLIYLTYHFRRTVGIRRPSLIFTGLLASLIIIVILATGFWISFNGHSESKQWIPILHSVCAFLFIGFLVLHLVFHFLQKQKESAATPFKTLSSRQSKLALFSIIAYSCCVLFLTGAYSWLATPKQSESDNYSNYEYSYGNHPFLPSQTETHTGDFIKVEQIAKSAQCGACHTDIYEQWLSSTHRQSASDPAYVKNVNLLEQNKGISATRYCEGCHAPVALLTGQLTPGGKHGGVPNTPAHNEGVGCMGCHGIENVIHTNGTASFTFNPQEFYLFDSSTNYFGQQIRNFLIRLHPYKHKSAMSSEVLKDPKLCASCHEQFMDESMNNWGWVKMQSEYVNWLKSPFSGQSEQEFQHTASMRCQDCHFPLVTGSDPSATNTNLIRSHRSPGANTILPILNEDKKQFEITKRFLQEGRLRIDIEEPDRKDTIHNKTSIEQQSPNKKIDNSPYFLYLDETASLRLTVYNQMVGHSFPAGTTDLNQAWLYIKVTDNSDRLIYESGGLNDNLELDKSAHVYHTIPVDRNGKEVWKHDLFRMVGESYKNLIPAGGSDIVDYQFNVPSWAKTPLTVTAILKYRKFNQKYARWVFDHPKPELPIIDMARDTLTIPLKIKPLAIQSE